MKPVLTGLFSLQFAPDVKIYSYFRIYTEDNLIADIGGYLGLFLGLSVYSLFEFLEGAIESLNKGKDKNGLATVC